MYFTWTLSYIVKNIKIRLSKPLAAPGLPPKKGRRENRI